MENKNRLIFADILRIIAMFGVVAIHSVSIFWEAVPVTEFGWAVLASINSACRFAVPVFVMISGMFLLSPEKDRGIKNLYSKNLLRILTAFAFWSVIYAVYRAIFGTDPTAEKQPFNLTDFVRNILNGEYHLWFLFMIAGLYIVTPLLRKITQEKKLTEYFLGIWFVFCICANAVNLAPIGGSFAYEWIDEFRISMALQYSGYFVLGYYLNNNMPKKNHRIILYILGIISVIFTAAVTIRYSVKEGSPNSTFLDYLLPTTMFTSAALFVFVKKICENRSFSTKKTNFITNLSKYSFGIYLCHLLIIFTLRNLGIVNIGIPTVVIFLIAFVSTSLISTIISAVLNKIPVINKYIV